jgi:hypothetical protein
MLFTGNGATEHISDEYGGAGVTAAAFQNPQFSWDVATVICYLAIRSALDFCRRAESGLDPLIFPQ